FLSRAPAATAIYTLSLHDALPISEPPACRQRLAGERVVGLARVGVVEVIAAKKPLRVVAVVLQIRARAETALGAFVEVQCELQRSEEHTSELQSRSDLVCRLLLEK